MGAALKETKKILDEARRSHEAALVAFSGGKDSLCVAELCSRTFARMEFFFMYFVPGLECTEEQLDYGRRRYGVPIRQYPHWCLADAIHSGVFGFERQAFEDVPKIQLSDIYGMAREDSGIPLIVTGAKKGDSLWRRRMLNGWGKANANLIYPVVSWTKLDVLAYLSAQGIPRPDLERAQRDGGRSLYALAALAP